MKIYQVADSVAHFKQIKNYGTRNILISNRYMTDTNKRYFKSLSINKELHTKVSLFLDSGAFTAFMKKTEINVNKYIFDLLKIHHMFDIIASLDVIGNAERSYENFMQLRGYPFSDRLYPVWHSNADVTFVKKYLDKTRNLAIGKLVALKYPQRIAVLNKVVSYIKKQGYKFYSDFDPDTHKDGIKMHLFGVNDIQILRRFPEAYSSDSTTWLAGEKFACLYAGTGLTVKRFTYPKRIKSHYNFSSINNLTMDRKTQEFLTEYQHRLFLEKALKLNNQ